MISKTYHFCCRCAVVIFGRPRQKCGGGGRVACEVLGGKKTISRWMARGKHGGKTNEPQRVVCGYACGVFAVNCRQVRLVPAGKRRERNGDLLGRSRVGAHQKGGKKQGWLHGKILGCGFPRVACGWGAAKMQNMCFNPAGERAV